MSNPTTILGKNIPLALSLDDVTYKNLVCETAHDVTIDAAVNITQSDCGPQASVAVPGLVMTFSGLLNTTPNGATEMSADDLLVIANNTTKVYLKTMPGAKLIKGLGYINNFVYTKVTDALISWSFTFTASGSATITP